MEQGHSAKRSSAAKKKAAKKPSVKVTTAKSAVKTRAKSVPKVPEAKYPEFAKNFNARLDAAGYPGLHYGRQVEVGKIFGISTSAARKWVMGDCLPDHENLLKICDTLGVGLDTLFGRSPRIGGEPMVSIPLGMAPPITEDSAKKSSKSGRSPWLNQFSSIQMEAAWIETGMRMKSGNLYLVTVAGDSMSPTLNNGDTVFVDATPVKIDEIVENGIYLIRSQGRTQIRRILVGIDNKVTLSSDNKHFPSITGLSTSEFKPGRGGVTPAIEIIGSIAWCIHRVSRASENMPVAELR